MRDEKCRHDLGALVFYSGNILLDLLTNFIFAIPEIFTLLITGFMMIFNVDGNLINQVQFIVSIMFSVLYFISLINIVISTRSGRFI